MNKTSRNFSSRDRLLVRISLANSNPNLKKAPAIKPMLYLNLNTYAPTKRPTRQLDFLESEKSSRIKRCKSSMTKRLDSTKPKVNILREKVVDSIDLFSFKKGGDPAISPRSSDD